MRGVVGEERPAAVLAPQDLEYIVPAAFLKATAKALGMVVEEAPTEADLPEPTGENIWG